MSASISFDIYLKEPYDQAVDRTIEALKMEGFGILTRINLHDAFQEKLGVEFRRYAILGACNPSLAHRATTAVPEVGLFLPCNVTVESTADDGSLVRIVNPNEMMKAGGFDEDNEVAAVGAEAFERLRRVADALAE